MYVEKKSHVFSSIFRIKSFFSTFIVRCNATAIVYYHLVRMLVLDGKAIFLFDRDDQIICEQLIKCWING
jgi:hypothetical protein